MVEERVQCGAGDGPWQEVSCGVPPSNLIVWVFVLFSLRGVNADFGATRGDYDASCGGWSLDDGVRGVPLLWCPLVTGAQCPPLPDQRWALQLLRQHMRMRG